MKPLVLCILDGVGYRKKRFGNAVYEANMPNYDMLMKKYPHSLLNASEEYVGLPRGQMGNSEVGHSNIGAGRIVYQPQQLINNKIKTKEFFENKNLSETINHVKQNNSKLHILGLLSDGGIHSHIDHLMNLIDMAKNNGIEQIYFHVFLDGRDTAPNVALTYLNKLEEKIKKINMGVISTISGRYYAMDRDNRWERVKKAYDAIVYGEGINNSNYEEEIKKSYEKEVYDEFIEPIVVNKEGTLNDNDGLIVFNYRPDRLRQLLKAITNESFNEFKHKKFRNVKLTTMFYVSDEIKGNFAFEKQELNNNLGIVLSNNDKTQLRIAETEKYAHVTYFFDGGKEIDLKGKKQILIPSPKIATYDLKPEMSAYKITDKLIKEMNKYDVVILNYANGDMVGHTGKIDATISALEHLDICLGKLYNKVIELGGTLIVTADHGNSDLMLDKKNNPVTTHTMSKVPFIITNKNLKLKNGKLSDIAPTILELLNIKKPVEMTGNSLIKKKHILSNIFIVLSCIFIIGTMTYYGIRFKKYYDEENNIILQENINLLNLLKNNIVVSGNGLYYQNGEYVFRGKCEDNYLLYSGIMFRIVKINSDSSIKLVTDKSILNLKKDDLYINSDVRKYLNKNEDENTGLFYSNLENPDIFLTNINDLNDKVGLLTKEDYVNSLGIESYLNNGTYFWLMDDNYIFNTGGIGKENVNYYGIRPVINLKSDVILLRGNGTKDNPYIIEDTSILGKYVNFSNYTWKIIDDDEQSYKLALNELLPKRKFSYSLNNFSINDKTSLAYYLNTTFLNSLDSTKILEHDFYNGSYNNNYLDIYKNSIKSYVGLMSVTDNFINDFDNYYLINPSTSDMVYSVSENSRLKVVSVNNELGIRPVIYISKTELSGKGTLDEPYIIE